MSNVNLCVKQLISDMITDRQHYIALNELLEQQRLLIIARNSTELDAVNEQLIGIYQHLSQSGQQRYALLQQLGVPSGALGIKALFARLPVTHKTQVSALWDSLEAQATRCKTLNEGNGTLLGMQQDILQNLINANEPENWLYQQV